jgi:hypothetical protein
MADNFNGRSGRRNAGRSLQKLMDKNHVRHPSFQLKPVPTPDELQIEFITWLLDRPQIPFLVAPANSGFYDEVYGRAPPAKLGSVFFFDEEHVHGQRQFPLSYDSHQHTLNPAQRPEPTYHEVCVAELASAPDIDRHESRIYQPGYTPTAIRNNSQKLLRESNTHQHMVDFREIDIPPPNRDEHTHRIVTDLMQQRNKLGEDFALPLQSVVANGTALDTNRSHEQDKKRDHDYNRLNRSLYHVYDPETRKIRRVFWPE